MAAQAQSGDTDAGLRHDLAESEAALSEFLEAEVVVIGSPMYNYTISSQLKAWIDRLAVAGRTFRYTEDGPQGLARGKRIVATLSRGGFYGGETQAAAEHQEGYLRAIFGMFGVDDFVFIKAEGTAVSTEAREAAVADALLTIASADLALRIGGQSASI